MKFRIKSVATASLLVSTLFAEETSSLEENPIQEAETSQETIELSPVIVTGSNMDLLESQTFAQVVTISYDDIVLHGNQLPIERLRLLPSFIGSQLSENRSNGGMGNASINLRGQGALSSLTLINGRRAGGNGAINPPLRPGGFADISLIPAPAIEKIEVFKEGASSVYGSDAMAGVVNLILENDYDGTRFDALYGNTTDGDAAVKQFSFIGGTRHGKTNITVAGSYYDRNAIFRDDRSLTANADDYIRSDGFSLNQNFPVSGNLLAFNPGFSFTPGNPIDTSSFTADSPSQQLESLYGAIEHELTDNITIYGDLLFSRNQINTQIFPFFVRSSSTSSAGSFEADLFAAAEASAFNPFNPGELFLFDIDTRAAGPFKQAWKSEGFRGVAGIKGTLLEEYDWDAGVLHTETDITGDFDGSVNGDAILTAIQNGTFDPFSGVSATNDAIIRNNLIHIVNTYKEEMSLFDLSLSGDVIDLPSGSIQFSSGLEVRRESIEFIDDPIHEGINNTIGVPDLSNFSGDRNVSSAFVESIVPIISPKQKLRFLNELSLNIGGRFEDFGDKGTDPASATGAKVHNEYESFDYKIAARLKPIEDITFRASYSTGFRAPTLAESFSRFDATNRIALVDPTGVTPAGTTVNHTYSGNAQLEPETSQNIGAGITLTPSFVPGLTASVDFYHIKRSDAIVNGAQFILDNETNPAFAGLVTRDGSGIVTDVTSRYFNAASIITRGVEYELNYFYPIAPNNSIDITIGANQFLTYKIQASENSSYQSFKGKAVDPERNNLSPGSIPTWKGFCSVFWYIEDFTWGITANYIGKYDDDSNFTTGSVEREVESYVTLDLVLSYQVPASQSKLLANTVFTVGIENIADEQPPFSAGSLAGPPLGGYDQSLYNTRGRFYYLGISREL